MLQNHTGFQHFPLSAAGGGDNPALVQGSPTVFNLNTIPLFQGTLANYVPALLVTITGILTQSGGTGVRLIWNNLFRILVESLEVRNCWHGSPITPQNVKGAMLPIIEQFAGGYRGVARKRGVIPAANGANNFSFTFPVPLSLGLGSKPHHTAQLAALYKEAQFSLQVAQASVLTALSPGATLSGLQVRCSAILLPDPELRVGPVVEFVDYQVAATAGQVNIPIQSFGNNSQLTKMDKGSGLFYFGMLSNQAGLPGPFSAEQIVRLNVPWRGQTDTGHIPPYIAQQIAAMGNQRFIGGTQDQGAAGALSDVSGFPYLDGFDPTGSTATTASEQIGLLAMPIVTPGADLELSKLQVVDGDESINAQFSSGPAGTFHMLAGQARSWQPSALNDLTQYLVNLGLPTKILKGGSGGLTWMVKSLRKNDDIDAKKARFLPLVLKRQNKDKPFNPTTNPTSRRLKLKAA
jgi:hypothetical protein